MPAETKSTPAPELNEAERELLETFRARKAESITVPRAELKDVDGDERRVELAHKSEADFNLAEAVLCEALGTEDTKYAGSLINSIANASAAPDRLTENGHQIIGNAIVAASTLKAESPAEGMLIAQMIAVHNSAMTMLAKMHSSTHIKQMDSMANQANKLLRTFAAQMETLKRFRQKASQTVRVERVYVNEGGQAIVGNVTHGGAGDQQKSEVQAHALRYAPGTPMRGEDSEREALPVTGNEKRQVSDAWRVIDGRTEGE